MSEEYWFEKGKEEAKKDHERVLKEKDAEIKALRAIANEYKNKATGGRR